MSEKIGSNGEPDVDQRPQAQEPPEGDESRGFTVKDRRFWNVSEEERAEEEQRSERPSYVEQLKKELEEKDLQLKDYIAAYKKEVVEGLEKTKERLERDSAMKQDQLRGQMATPMLEVLDALEMSISAGESRAADVSALIQGVKLVHQLMVQKLQELGLTRVETTGKAFDPTFCEAVAVVPVTDEAQHNIVMAELKPGFMLGERVVRPALVQVGKYGG